MRSSLLSVVHCRVDDGCSRLIVPNCRLETLARSIRNGDPIDAVCVKSPSLKPLMDSVLADLVKAAYGARSNVTRLDLQASKRKLQTDMLLKLLTLAACCWQGTLLGAEGMQRDMVTSIGTYEANEGTITAASAIDWSQRHTSPRLGFSFACGDT